MLNQRKNVNNKSESSSKNRISQNKYINLFIIINYNNY